ncbi:MAG: hypothetical protein F6K58_20000 [Symploca sp. SIO2E9]|nr:hypothetical protein [Symploca sp. SIO2E9]
MGINVKKNVNFKIDSPNSTQKYTPLDVKNLTLDNETEYKEIFQQRINLLKNRKLLPSQLRLGAIDWKQIKEKEAEPNALPPIVVISSQRDEWLEIICDRVKNLEVSFTDVNDNSALIAGATPWYHPKRINDSNRSVYIVVHLLELKPYLNSLRDHNLTIIGWCFNCPEKETFVGFGASRFAAIEFCKHILPRNEKKDRKAWLVDDNVVFVENFPGFSTVEEAMDKKSNIWGLGFKGATCNKSDYEFSSQGKSYQGGEWMEKNLDDNGVLQQCVLWNIEKLNEEKINFSPYFITSNEDTSLSNYLMKKKPSKLRIYSPGKIYKGQHKPNNKKKPRTKPQYDINYQRDNIIKIFGEREKTTIVNPPSNQEYELGKYIEEKFTNDDQKNKVQSIAIEQIMAHVVEQQKNWVPQEIFQPNITKEQNIEEKTINPKPESK